MKMANPLRLYTWVDVERELREAARRNEWPDGLVEVDAWWDSLELAVADPEDQRFIVWLGETFGPLLELDPPELRLETGERLPITLVAAGGEPGARRPRLRSERVTRLLSTPLRRPAHALDGPPVVAFHSFKGGVGRTLHALATSRVLAATAPVLLIDGDLEAPGVTWMLEQRLAEPGVAYADLLALLHGAPDENRTAAVLDLVAARLSNQMLDGIYVMPTTRSHRPDDVAITPADLISGSRDPYHLTDSLSRLASRVGAGAVIVDLRAGFSELSAGLLLDPRVHRVFVTSLSYQSLAGTSALLSSIASDSPSTEDDDPVPAAILSLVPDRVPSEQAEQDLSSALDRFVAATPGRMTDPDKPVVVSPLRQEWLVLPPTWDEVMAQVSVERAGELVSPIAQWIAPSGDASDGPPLETTDLDDARQRLAEAAERLVYAETSLSAASTVDFMPTAALARLASDHRTEVPATVVVGAKGAGKTFTFLNLALASTWEEFASAARPGVDLDKRRFVDARIVPALGPKNAPSVVQQRLVEARRAAGGASSEVPTSLELHESIEAALQDPPSGSGAWRRFWLHVLLTAIGDHGTVDDAEDRVRLRARAGERLIFVIDGLEEAFLGFATEERQQAAIRALIQDVPAWLQLLEGRPFGLVVFVREDIVRAVLPQNAGQLLQQHRAYALTWGDDEVLRLALWLASRAGAIADWNSRDVIEKPPSDVETALVRLWGRKMGSARSREARSTPWVLAALSDFRPQIQARDLVNFMYQAAKGSTDESATDRILTPSAMRAALERCSSDKIRAIQEEDPRLGALFTQLRNQPAEKRRAPFAPGDLGLSQTDVDLLESTGAAMRIGDLYWLPEIFRQGLNFQNAVSRPRVIQLANRARR